MLGASATTTTTPSACKPVAVRDINAARPAANQVAYAVISGGQGGITTAAVKAGTSCVGPLISLVTYKTTASNGMPRNKQTLYDSQTKALAPTVVNLSVRVPDCYYQTDLVYGMPLDLRTGVDYTASTNFIWGVTGGTRGCVNMTGASTQTSSPAATTTPRPTVVVQPINSPAPSTTSTSTTPTPGAGGQNTPAPTPSIIPLAPGESVPMTPVSTAIFSFLPQTGQSGSLMSFLGALLVSAGLLQIYLTQRRKLLNSSK